MNNGNFYRKKSPRKKSGGGSENEAENGRKRPVENSIQYQLDKQSKLKLLKVRSAKAEEDEIHKKVADMANEEILEASDLLTND